MAKLKKRLPGNRTLEQITNHYEVEKAIANRLRQATREERKSIYRTMYDELFVKVPDHPRLTRRENPNQTKRANKQKFRLVRKFINKETAFVEFAPGDCRFAKFMCPCVKSVYGIDISDQKGAIGDMPDNFCLKIYDGFDLSLPDNTADVVFSDQLLEHLHPEDTEAHFRLVQRILKPGGVYVFRTPHRYTGPRDISKYFSDEAEGFHLKEWTYAEMEQALNKNGFSSWSGYWFPRVILLKMPKSYFRFIEYIFNGLPARIRRYVSMIFVPNVTIVAVNEQSFC